MGAEQSQISEREINRLSSIPIRTDINNNNNNNNNNSLFEPPQSDLNYVQFKRKIGNEDNLIRTTTPNNQSIASIATTTSISGSGGEEAPTTTATTAEENNNNNNNSNSSNIQDIKGFYIFLIYFGFNLFWI